MRPEFNGQSGGLSEYIDDEARWQVLLDSGTGLKLRADNIQELPDAPENSPASDAAAAEEVIDCEDDWEDGMYNITGGDTTSLAQGTDEKYDEVLDVGNAYYSGLRVQVVDLKQRPELNGKQGALHEYEDNNGRWQVIMDDGSGLSLRETNLQPLHCSGRGSAEDSKPQWSQSAQRQEGQAGLPSQSLYIGHNHPSSQLSNAAALPVRRGKPRSRGARSHGNLRCLLIRSSGWYRAWGARSHSTLARILLLGSAVTASVVGKHLNVFRTNAATSAAAPASD